MTTTVVFQVSVHDEGRGVVLSAKVDDEAVIDLVDGSVSDGDPDLDRRQQAIAIATTTWWPAWDLGT